MIGHYDSDVVRSRQIAEETTETDELGRAFGHCETRACGPCAGALLAVGELSAVVCGDGVEYDKADVVACDGDG